MIYIEFFKKRKSRFGVGLFYIRGGFSIKVKEVFRRNFI